MNSAHLHLDIRSYWCAGTGAGSGHALDMRVHRDADGLPALPGKSLKGLLRDALRQADSLGWSGLDIANDLFGSDNASDQISAGSRLHVGNAVLPRREREALLAEPALISGLFGELHNTAIDDGTGSAAGKSLRGHEVAIPLPLEATLHTVPGSSPPDADAWAALENSLALIRGLGGGRRRGLGRVLWRLERL